MPTGAKRAKITVEGIVQGVGFRPFVFRLASQYTLTGWVRNTSGTVEATVEGKSENLDRFLSSLRSEVPPQARIESLRVTFHPPRGYTAFVIEESNSRQDTCQPVSPDVATCPECLRELFSPDDRRFRYPFINCTHCGPRFTIIEALPYDRERTTMRQFDMCPDCRKEYEDPMNRRFHAQPNACPVCGPTLSLQDKHSIPIACSDPFKEIARRLRQGQIVALKGLGGFLLACDATKTQVVVRLRNRKYRPDKPLAVMVSTLDEAHNHCHIDAHEAALLTSSQAPIVLLQRRESSAICFEVAPRLGQLGLMLPYTPLHHLLLREVNRPLVMTSGNRSHEPIAADNNEARQQLKSIADCFLTHNRDIRSRCDDSVYRVEDGKSRAIRRSRGHSSRPIRIPFKLQPILACGGQLKNTFCLACQNHAFISRHIGDLENEETLRFFEESIAFEQTLFGITPEVIAHDLHPDYLSTRYARHLLKDNPELQGVAVQHHHAHIAACMAENGVSEKVIGVAFDGTGLGTDGHLWGSEFLIADYQGFKRMAHFEYAPMPGGEAAIREPFRMALSYLAALDIDFPDWPLLSRIDPIEIEIINRQIQAGINAPLSCSAGRLFDAVAALLAIRTHVSYEAQAAIELEALATDTAATSGGYPFEMMQESDVRVIRLGKLLKALIEDSRKRVPASTISSRFHTTLAQIVAKTCLAISEESGIRKVALSGGVFQNRVLFNQTVSALQQQGFEVLTHSKMPANDGGIALGQAMIAHFSTQRDVG